MRFGSTSMTVTGTVSPASVKMRVMPALRPIRATLMTILSFLQAFRLDACGVASSYEGTLRDAAQELRREARVVLGLELRRLAQPRPISLKSIAWMNG
jgi:hypothetical protein